MKHVVLFALLVCTGYAQQVALKPATGKRVALVIGNNRYSTSPLENCVRDAAAIARLLREQLRFDTVLADKESEDLSRLGFMRRLQTFQAEAKDAEIALFYYAGHGMEDFDGRDNYLIPVDADLIEAAKDNAGLQSQGISLDSVLASMKTATSGAKIILLDCCRERPADRAIRTRDGGGLGMPADADLPQDTLIMLAAAPDRTASDGSSGHGPFTAALLKHLPTQGTALHQMFRMVRNEVLVATNQQQKPWLKLDGGGDFFYERTLVGEVPGSPTHSGIAATKENPFVNSLGMKFVPVPIGAGSSRGKRVFFSIWETRSKDYAAFMKSGAHTMKGFNGEAWKTHEYYGVPVGRGAGETVEDSTHPVQSVSQDDAAAFCVWLTGKDRAAGMIGMQDEYRLPTDVEWSYAVGIGEREDVTATPKSKSGMIADIYPWGKSFPPPSGSGNYADTAGAATYAERKIEGYADGHATTAPVGSFKGNPLGIHDLGGNLWEWTSSPYEEGKEYSVLRGGSWDIGTSARVSSSYRRFYTPADRDCVIGFRCVLVVVGDQGWQSP